MSSALTRRVLARLERAELLEPNKHYQTDIRIAWLTVLYAGRGDAVECSPNVLATMKILGCHPDRVWEKIEAERRAKLGSLYDEIFGQAFSPKKPVRSVTLDEERRRRRG